MTVLYLFTGNKRDEWKWNLTRGNDNIAAMRRAALDRARNFKREITKREKGKQGNAKITWSPKLAKLKRSKERPWSDSPSLLERKKQLRFRRVAEAALSFHRGEMKDRSDTQGTLIKVTTNRKLECGECHPLVIPWTPRRLFLILSKPFRFASIAFDERDRDLSRWSDIDFKCRVCKSKKWANVHGYLYYESDLLIQPQKAFSPCIPCHIGVKGKNQWEIF